jgi:hypothetical protein
MRVDLAQIEELVKKAELHGDITYLESEVTASNPDEVRLLAVLLSKKLGDNSVITLVAKKSNYIFPGILFGKNLKDVYDAREIHLAMDAASRAVGQNNPGMSVPEVIDLAMRACFDAAREKVFGLSELMN